MHGRDHVHSSQLSKEGMFLTDINKISNIDSAVGNRCCEDCGDRKCRVRRGECRSCGFRCFTAPSLRLKPWRDLIARLDGGYDLVRRMWFGLDVCGISIGGRQDARSAGC